MVGAFDGEELSSDGGALALRELEDRAGILKRLAGCFTDHRAAGRVEHDVETLVKQRVMGICLGYEDLNDHDELRRDRLMALLCECADVTGAGRRRAADRGRPLAGKSTLNRLELSVLEAAAADRYKKVVADTAAMDALLLELFVEAHETPPAEIVLDIDATDDPLHGNQEGRFFHGHYDCYRYLPLYVFCGEHLLCARLREASGGDAAGVLDEVRRIATRLRARWPDTSIVVRGDGGFCRESLMAWCEASGLDFILGLPRNSVLTDMVAATLYETYVMAEMTGETTRRYDELRYAARGWSRRRRVVARVEHSPLGPNPRFVVTNIAALSERALYEDLYCARGDMENRIKGAPGELATVQPVQVRREGKASHRLPPRVMDRRPRGRGLSVDRGASRQGDRAPRTVTTGMSRLSLTLKTASVQPPRRWVDGVPRCLRTQACSYALRRDLGGLRAVPRS